ncbi:MAG: TonB family protein [Prevotella sp.]|nr:TonB family protein [Prevotella sp.]MDY4038634.1 TonB family protein [Prevotella sp.]
MKRISFQLAICLTVAITACTSKTPQQHPYSKVDTAKATVGKQISGPQVEQPKAADLTLDRSTDNRATFKGGSKAMRDFINSKMVYPRLALQLKAEGRVIVSADIDKSGILSNFGIFQSDDRIFNEEALRIVRLMPQWVPAMKGGEPVATTVKIPVIFRMKTAL